MSRHFWLPAWLSATLMVAWLAASGWVNAELWQWLVGEPWWWLASVPTGLAMGWATAWVLIRMWVKRAEKLKKG